jgi:phosphoglycerate dehydrogenase-like enzyme
MGVAGTRILVTAQAVSIRPRLAAILDGLPVTLLDVDAGPADALIVAQDATEDVRHGLRAGVRWIQSVATGVETVLVPGVVESDIVVTNSAGTTAGPVAEFTFARILEHAKRLPYIAARQREHAWDRFFHNSLEGATLAVVGLGPIGRRVASLAKAFDMDVIGVRRRPEAGPGPCDEVYGADQLPEVMARSDYVVLLAAVTPETRGLLDRRALEAAKEGSFIENVGRAELVDHDALIEAATAGRVSAALDVVPEEPLPPESPLWDTPGIAISSHIAVWTPVLINAIVDLVDDNIRRFIEGRALLNVVDKTLGYPLT